jgi:hypothetical protein
MKLELHKTLVWVKNLFFRRWGLYVKNFASVLTGRKKSNIEYRTRNIEYNNKKGSRSRGTHYCINGATVRDRTADLSITNALLYQLSYGGTSFVSLLCL